jgi:hypothetical protein
MLEGYIYFRDMSGKSVPCLYSSSITTKEGIMPTIFVRERRKIETGEKKPRFRVVGVHDLNLRIYVEHIRKRELDQLAEATGAGVVILKGGKGEKEKENRVAAGGEQAE